MINTLNDKTKIIKKYHFKEKTVKTILNKRHGPRQLFMEDYSFNIYNGCTFDCSYCYINGSKYAEDTKTYYVKTNANDLLHQQLKNKAKKGERALFTIGSASDPYMEIEKELFMTREFLKIANKFHYPVHIVTKSDLICRDIDILQKINKNSILPMELVDKIDEKVIVSFSFSTVFDDVAKIFEPNAPKPTRRLKSIKKLKDAGFRVGITFMPILPFITDNDKVLRETIKIFKDYNVDYILPSTLTLYGESENDCRYKYLKKVKKFYPEYYDETKKLFESKVKGKYLDYPNKHYQYNLLKKVKNLSKEYNISNLLY
ncbi:MAG: radical SAM protein [Methanobacteriaceae archaeon]|nr:radical SAM protein [Methanobacteriaceae archaeon]MDD4593624.1 radical SAM protein [Methanobacteriaceae archaeon]